MPLRQVADVFEQELEQDPIGKDKNDCIDSDGMEKDVEIGNYICYWRPSKQRKKWWYNGKVESLQNVQFPSGKRALVLGIN